MTPSSTAPAPYQPSTGQASAQQAAQMIWAHWQSGQVMNALPQACRPMTSAQGYAAQAQLPVVSGREVVGWKIAATSANGQAHINVSGPLAGRLLSGQVLGNGATVPSAGGNVLGDPRIALTWLANQLSSLGITLQKGQVVTTGTCMVPLELQPGDSVNADYGPLGRVHMIFSET